MSGQTRIEEQEFSSILFDCHQCTVKQAKSIKEMGVIVRNFEKNP